MRIDYAIGLLLFLAAATTQPANCCAAGDDEKTPSTIEAKHRSAAFNVIFGDSILQDNVIAVCNQAENLTAAERYRVLADWVLPPNNGTSIRLKGKFCPSSRIQMANAKDAKGPGIRASLSGLGSIESPALDLIDVAEHTGHLDELRDRVGLVAANELSDRRCRAAMLFLVEMARDDSVAARAAFDELISLSDQASRDTADARWPELLALWVGIPNPKTRKIVGEYFFTVYAKLDPYVVDSELDVMNDYARALSGLSQYLQEEPSNSTSPNDAASFSHWEQSHQFVLFSYSDAETRGHGRPLAHWKIHDGEAYKLAGHELDHLSFRSPLQGNYEVECDCSTGDGINSALMVAGHHVEVSGESTLKSGQFRKRLVTSQLPQPLSKFQDWVHHRAVVQDGVLTHFINGHLVLEKTLAPDHDPWIALRSWRRSHPRIRSFRITGSPVIPEQIHLTGDPELGGWMQYYGEDFGSTAVEWVPLAEDGKNTGMLARRIPEQQGMNAEELIRYARPMLEDGTIEYEFFHEAGQFAVHPALDRMCFLLQPEGVRIHWLTDGKFDLTELEPDNMLDEPGCRRGPEKLPLIQGNWNKLRLTLSGHTVTLLLNGTMIYERDIVLTDSLNFGLFHFADQSTAKVRNVVWQGDWPKQLPSVDQQQLAKSSADLLDQTVSQLPAMLHHDFRTGVPVELFDTSGDETQIEQTKDGIRTPRAGDGGVHELRACLQIHGDYDIVVRFRDLGIGEGDFGKSGLGLMTVLDNLTQDTTAIYRRAGDSAGQQRAHFAHKSIQEDGDIKYAGGHLVEESLSGRLRLARRGQTVYGLYAEGDSPNFRLVYQQQVPADDVAPQGLRLLMHSERQLPASVTWCDLLVRAERISGLPIEKPEPILAALNQKRSQPPEKSINFADAAEVAESFLVAVETTASRTIEADGLRITLPSNGPDQMVQLVGTFRVGSEFDVESQLKVHRMDLPVRIGQHSEVAMHVNLAAAGPDNTSNPKEATLTIRQKANGVRKLVARVVKVDRVGNSVYLPIRSMSVESLEKLRIAVDARTIYFLYSEANSVERVFAEYTCDQAPVAGLIAVSSLTKGRDRLTDVTWQKLTAHGKLPVP